MSFTLYYLPLRARAEAIRMILTHGDVSYENVVIPAADWPDFKATREICPFGQLPTIKLPSGEIIAQSGAIIRFVAKMTNLYPADPVEAARADMIFELAQEMNVINPILNFWPMNSELWQKNHDAYFNNLPQYMTSICKFLGNKPFFGGDNLVFSDFSMFAIVDATLTVRPDSLNDFLPILQWYQRMKAVPSVRRYLRERAPDNEVGMCGSFISVACGNIHHHK